MAADPGAQPRRDRPWTSIADRYPTAPLGDDEDGPPEPSNDDDEATDLGAYSLLGPRRQELFLDLRLRCGDDLALPYVDIAGMRHRPGEGTIIIALRPGKVTIRGRNLKAIYQALLSHRVRFIRECDERPEFQADDAVVVESITAENLPALAVDEQE